MKELLCVDMALLSIFKRYFCSQYTAGSAMMMASASNGMFTGWATATLPIFLTHDSPIPLDETKISWVMSLHFLGNILGAVPAGILMDKFGRKSVLLLAGITLPLTSWLLVAVTQTSWLLLMLARLISGIWNGVVATVAPIYLSEIAEPNRRGCLNTLMTLSFRLGNLFTVLAALLVSYQKLPLILSSTTILFLMLFPFVPESPFYYLKHAKNTSAGKSLKWLRNSKPELDVRLELKNIEDAVKKQITTTKTTFFTTATIKALLIVETLSILMRLAGIAPIINYISVSLPGADVINPNLFVLLIEVTRLISSFVSSIVIDRLPRRYLLMGSSMVCAVAMSVTAFWYYFDGMQVFPLGDDPVNNVTIVNITVGAPLFSGNTSGIIDGQNREDLSQNLVEGMEWIPLTCIVVHGIFYSFGVSAVYSTIRSEMFAMNVKGECSAVTSIVSALTSFTLSHTFSTTKALFGLHFNFGMYAFSNLMITLFALSFVLETTGKTLQQIQDDLDSSSWWDGSKTAVTKL